MPKKINHVFLDSLTFEKLYQAHRRAAYAKTSKTTVLKFELDLETNLATLLTKLENGTYHVGKYYDFTIYEPKERLIRALPYPDRVIHQWYVEEFIKPYIVPKFICDSYACLENKGTHRAVYKLQKYMRIMKRKYGTYYIVKCDVKKFFYNIDKHILYDIICRYFKDKKFLEFTYNLIFDDEKDIGIPIGNYMSQYFANIYLNEIDHYMKDVLHVQYYVRYMDDFVFLSSSKAEAKELFQKATKFLNEHLNLEMNPKSRYFPNHFGVNFCGYRIYETHILLRKSSKIKMKRKIKKWNQDYLDEKLDFEYALASWNSWLAHAAHANSYNLRMKLEQEILCKELVEYYQMHD